MQIDSLAALPEDNARPASGLGGARSQAVATINFNLICLPQLVTMFNGTATQQPQQEEGTSREKE